MGIFDDKQRREAKKGLSHCGACSQYLDVLRQIGTPNEVMEQQNEANTRILAKSIELDEKHSQQPK